MHEINAFRTHFRLDGLAHVTYSSSLHIILYILTPESSQKISLKFPSNNMMLYPGIYGKMKSEICESKYTEICSNQGGEKLCIVREG